jgi:hypothetical protein
VSQRRSTVNGWGARNVLVADPAEDGWRHISAVIDCYGPTSSGWPSPQVSTRNALMIRDGTVGVIPSVAVWKEMTPAGP